MFGLRNSFNNSIIVNGEKIITNAGNIVINNGEIIANGKVIKSGLSGIVELKVEGDLMNISTAGNVTVHGDVHGGIDTTGNVNCQNVSGNIDTTGSVNCTKVEGNIDAMGSVNILK